MRASQALDSNRAAIRNVVAHGYFKVDYEIVWKTIQRELPTLYERVRSAAEELQRDMDRS